MLRGIPHEELIRVIQVTQPGLLVLGKKLISHGSGISAWKVVRQVGTAIWFVTEAAKVEKQNIVVPVDFSENSFRALRAALHLRKHSDTVRITALHVVDVPLTANNAYRDKNAIIAEIKASATRKFLQFLQEHGIGHTGIELQLTMNDKVDVAHYIREAALHAHSDLIVIGGKGQSFINNLLFGSVTEKLVTEEYSRPILVIR